MIGMGIHIRMLNQLIIDWLFSSNIYRLIIYDMTIIQSLYLYHYICRFEYSLKRFRCYWNTWYKSNQSNDWFFTKINWPIDWNGSILKLIKFKHRLFFFSIFILISCEFFVTNVTNFDGKWIHITKWWIIIIISLIKYYHKIVWYIL